jgi:DNA-binding NtrC family response regulator
MRTMGMKKPMNVLGLVELGQGDLASSIRAILEQAGASVFAFVEEPEPGDFIKTSGAVCVETIRRTDPDALLLCSGQSGAPRIKAALSAARSVSPEVPVIFSAQGTDPQHISEMLRLGASDFFSTPVKAVDLVPRLLQFRTVRRKEITQELKERLGLKDFIGESPALLSVLNQIPAVARCGASVLITGETGTGKELCARAIHYLSPRAERAFMPINCGSIPVELVENQLFGHEPGAFTGANSATPGLLRATDGGTVLLDEVDTLPLSAQVKLLRFLQDKQFQPLGSTRSCTVDLRIIAASNCRLEEAVRAGRFRPDLFYRLNVIPIQLPPLRNRREDIPLLAEYFLEKYSQKFGSRTRKFGGSALQKLIAYDWPGNVRELESFVQRALVLSERPLLHADDILLPVSDTSRSDNSFKVLKARAVEDFERTYLQQLLCAHEGNITRAAKAANKNRRAFWQLMRKHHLIVPSLASPC